jgi:hypothetical protein
VDRKADNPSDPTHGEAMDVRPPFTFWGSVGLVGSVLLVFLSGFAAPVFGVAGSIGVIMIWWVGIAAWVVIKRVREHREWRREAAIRAADDR